MIRTAKQGLSPSVGMQGVRSTPSNRGEKLSMTTTPLVMARLCEAIVSEDLVDRGCREKQDEEETALSEGHYIYGLGTAYEDMISMPDNQ